MRRVRDRNRSAAQAMEPVQVETEGRWANGWREQGTGQMGTGLPARDRQVQTSWKIIR